LFEFVLVIFFVCVSLPLQKKVEAVKIEECFLNMIAETDTEEDDPDDNFVKKVYKKVFFLSLPLLPPPPPQQNTSYNTLFPCYLLSFHPQPAQQEFFLNPSPVLSADLARTLFDVRHYYTVFDENGAALPVGSDGRMLGPGWVPLPYAADGKKFGGGKSRLTEVGRLGAYGRRAGGNRDGCALSSDGRLLGPDGLPLNIDSAGRLLGNDKAPIKVSVDGFVLGRDGNLLSNIRVEQIKYGGVVEFGDELDISPLVLPSDVREQYRHKIEGAIGRDRVCNCMLDFVAPAFPFIFLYFLLQTVQAQTRAKRPAEFGYYNMPRTDHGVTAVLVSFYLFSLFFSLFYFPFFWFFHVGKFKLF
jgi:hypothetical protein